MDTERVNRLIQYLVAVASSKGRDLRPIHILKFLYLADVRYAETNGGESYTGLPWKFFHFGPWCDIQDTFDDVLLLAGAEKREIPASSEDRSETAAFKFGRIRADEIVRNLRDEIHGAVLNSIDDSVDRFGGHDIADMLEHVYTTAPMRHAAPDDLLDLSTAVDPDAPQRRAPRRLSKAARSRLAKAKRMLAEKAKNRTRPERVRVDVRYDEVFVKGTQWLDDIDGEPVQPLAGEVRFHPSLWLSSARTDGHRSALT